MNQATFQIDPCIPTQWPGYSVAWVRGGTRYEVTVMNPHKASRGVASATLEVDASTTGGSTTLVAEVELGECTPVSTTSTSTSTTATTFDGAAAQPASAEAAATAPRFAG